MKRILIAALLCLVAIPALPDVSLNGVRIGARDPAAVAKFYQSAFGMQEVQRIQTPQMLEIMLNFGATPAAAAATRAHNNGGDIVIMQQPADTTSTLAHVVFTVSDLDSVVRAVKAAGGRMEREPFSYGTTGIRIGMGIDPAGNHFEMIQFPPAGK